MKALYFLTAASASAEEDGLIVIWSVITIVLLIMLTYGIRLAELFYAYFFKKPFYVHFYLFPKQLTDKQLFVLQTQFPFYRKLSPKYQLYFEHRVKRFISKYQFIGQQGQPITDDVKVMIAATSVMLTFGMRNYLYTVFTKIIVFPSKYYSALNQAYHIGEFNPALKTIAFSWEDFVAGYQDAHDNRNLGLHEFTHALHFQSVKSNHVSAILFEKMFEKIMQELKNTEYREKIRESGYFREYAFENRYEFLAVLLEHFFETPETFRDHFPVLYDHIKKMINFRDR